MSEEFKKKTPEEVKDWINNYLKKKHGLPDEYDCRQEERLPSEKKEVEFKCPF